MSDQIEPALLMQPQVSKAPPAFHLLAKPTGAACNLDCAYCFFLEKEALYPGSSFRMSDSTLEQYVRQLVEAQRTPEVNIAWQGGEPTLMGLDFFRRSVALAQKYAPPGTAVQHTIQTNGTLIDDKWAAFFKENGFLVGLSIDGPAEMHDAYRHDKGGAPTFGRVMRGLEYLKKHRVDWNALTTINHANAEHPLEVYRFLRDECGAQFIQFIPIVERHRVDGVPHGDAVTEHSVSAEQYGRFLIGVFEDWVRRDVGTVYVQMFDVALANWYGEPSGLCVFAETCGTALAMEHNGDLYACDHFVDPQHKLGNITETHMIELVASERQRKFGRDKLEALPQYCLDCDVRFTCHGGCPKDRFISAPDGQAGLNYLCAGYKLFFHHVDRPMGMMVQLLGQNRSPAEMMRVYQQQDQARQELLAKTGRNAPCPCGSGRKFKQCHGRVPSRQTEGLSPTSRSLPTTPKGKMA